ncbi:hypothetical protein EKG38_12005 [Shewanella canadensis]|uniref:Uncharacterized protein n=1 Tax=Shewanella canadensis TaxID=271096 RepID=A0A3S0IN38_9GAMM|nr:hypothetical protein [Shewanella canadensis]RTR38873.1 hypothetical protein EKG38_12005 [Shewanella canadensis]
MNKLNVNLSGYIKPCCLVGILLLTACAQVNDFPMGESYQQVKQVQILDPGAPERNDGIVGVLEGNYGERVMQAYRISNEAPKTGREKVSVKAID